MYILGFLQYSSKTLTPTNLSLSSNNNSNMIKLILFLITSHSAVSALANCNYIDFGYYAIPETICVEEDYSPNYFLSFLSRTFSHKYICTAVTTTAIQQEWGGGLGSYCEGTPAASISVIIGSNGHNYAKTEGEWAYSNIPIVDIQCGHTNICPFVQVRNYDQPLVPSSSYNGNIIPIVINSCISKKIFGCNQTNYWKIDFFDDQCTRPNSILFYNIEPNVYPKHTVCKYI